ncbi:MAG TPA: hypothetical protein VFT62_02400, partial [Mycobacteriales bacterium]|nr:hypothetical protein [Mycobacteriales bacterium]
MSIVLARRMLSAAATVAVAAAVAVTLAAPAQALPDAHPGGGTLVVRTAPPLAGVPVQAAGTTVLTDSRGFARFPVPSFAALSDVVRVPDTEVSPGFRVRLDRIIGRPSSGRPVVVGLDTFREVRWRFTDLTGAEVAPSKVQKMRLRSGAGQIITLRGPQLSEPLWLQATRIVRGIGTVESKELYYSIDQVLRDGGDLVYKAQQKFFPLNSPLWDIHLTFFRLTVQ